MKRCTDPPCHKIAEAFGRERSLVLTLIGLVCKKDALIRIEPAWAAIREIHNRLNSLDDIAANISAVLVCDRARLAETVIARERQLEGPLEVAQTQLASGGIAKHVSGDDMAMAHVQGQMQEVKRGGELVDDGRGEEALDDSPVGKAGAAARHVCGGEADDVVVGREDEGVEEDEVRVVFGQADESLDFVPGVENLRPRGGAVGDAVFAFENNGTGRVGCGRVGHEVDAAGKAVEFGES